MPDSDETQAGASAEKAYAKAAEDIAIANTAPIAAVKPEPEVASVATAVEIPSVKPKVELKPVVVAKPAPAQPAKTVAAKVKAAPKVKAEPKPVVAARTKAAPKTMPAAKNTPVKAASLTSISPKITPLKSTATTPSADAANKDKTMTMNKKVTTGFESIIGDAQTKAKDAFEKSTALFGDYADFTKGNIEAVVQSGKILAEGLQGMGSTLVSESRSAFETASADMKVMAAAKSPTDLMQLQSEMIRKSFDNAVAFGSKNTEAMIKLVSEAMGPLSSRMSLAVEKVRTATM